MPRDARMGGIIRGLGAGLAVALAVLPAASPRAAAQGSQIDIPAQDLAGALSQLARTANVELLFDQAQVSGKQTQALRTIDSPARALTQLLAGTGLSYQRDDAGAFIIVSTQFADSAAPRETTVDQPNAIAEILVIGHRTQNTDIRRTIDDIQPYQIADSASIDAAQSSTPEDFLRTRLPSDAQASTLSQAPRDNLGATRSQIDMRGLGPDQTLVLIDGRRLPSIPTTLGLGQPDLNGLSTADIERIESLGGSAGGIFGIGASGGVVNVVLKRQFDGADLRLTDGITDRGDGWQRGAEGRIGFTTPDGGTHLMMTGSFSQDDGLEFGDRSFVTDARALAADRLSTPRITVASSSINFNSVLGGNLTLIPSLGGGSLNAPTTFLPVNAPAVAAGGLAILKANAGRYDLSLSPDGQGAQQSLITPSRTDSFTITARQEIGSRLEAYVDFLLLDDDGHAVIPAINTTGNILQGGAPGNPFNQAVAVSFPTPGLDGQVQNLTRTDRLSAGLIARLGEDWTANLDAAAGEAGVRTTEDDVPNIEPINAIQGPAALANQLKQYSVRRVSQSQVNDRLDDINLRLAGPLFDLPGGPLTLTATGEWRREHSSGSVHYFTPSEVDDTSTPTQRQVSSVFLQALAPVLAKDSEYTLLRGLELQLALRGDDYRTTVQSFDAGLFGPASSVANRATIGAATVGARFTPLTGLTVRASVANGDTPPTPQQIVSETIPALGLIIDPKRGGMTYSNPADIYLLNLGGSPSLRPQQTTTITAGVVFEPPTLSGLRASIDYSRLSTSGEITNFAEADPQYFIDHETAFPGRVTRGPLTPADIAKGYTAGPITEIDTSYLQVGRSALQTVDFALDYVRPTPIGTLQFYAQATWEPSFVRKGDPFMPSYNLVDHADGPLSWRGNGGIDWTNGPWSMGINLQFLGAYSGYFATPITALQRSLLVKSDSTDDTGANSAHIPVQTFVDWMVAFRQAWRRSVTIEYRFGIKNLFDPRPPIVTGTFGPATQNFGLANIYNYSPIGGYSPYGDALGRRFAMTISATF